MKEQKLTERNYRPNEFTKALGLTGKLKEVSFLHPSMGVSVITIDE